MSRDLMELIPELQEKCKLLMQKCVENGSPIIVVQTYRSFEEQEAIYAQGRTRPGLVVTNARAGDSWHNYRRAFDVCFLLADGRLSWNGPWEAIGELGKSLGLEWGGDFQHFPDRPHFQLTDGISLATMKLTHNVTRIESA